MPVLLLLLLLPVIEIYLLIQVASRFGFVNALFALLAACVLGAGIAKAQGRYIVAKMQASMAQGQVPARDVVHGLLIFIGGVLLLIPGFATDAAAVLFIIPGPRHLLVEYFRRKIERELKSGKFRVFTTGAGAFGGVFGGGFPPRPGHGSSSQSESFDADPWARDVTPKVIDIKPLSSQTTSEPTSKSEKPES